MQSHVWVIVIALVPLQYPDGLDITAEATQEDSIGWLVKAGGAAYGVAGEG